MVVLLFLSATNQSHGVEDNKTVQAEKYCSECEETYCAECTESHRRFKMLKSHHVIDLSSVGARKLPSSSFNVSESKDEILTSFQATSKGKTVP
jgi:hypothetical protein